MRNAIERCALIGLIAVAGCDTSSPAPTVSSTPPTVAVPPPPPPPPPPVNATGDGTTTVTGDTQTELSPADTTQQPAGGGDASPINTDPNSEVVKAQAGVGIKGRSLDEYEGVVVTPVKSLFAFKERAVFDIQIPEALKLYKALNDNRGPKDFAEFKAVIVDANNIRLPELPPGQRYDYNPETEELVVVRPKKKSE